MKIISFVFTAGLTIVWTLQGAALKQAEITQIINQVAVIQPGSGERPAAVNDVVQGKLGVRTGQKSRAELVFSDKTLTRLGANTIFNFEDGTRNLDLQQGVILLQVPKNAGGATIRTAAVTAAITGTTVLVEHTPKDAVPLSFSKKEEKRNRVAHGYIKILVLEGTLKVWLKKLLGESVLLGPGQMLFMADDGTRISDSVDFDIEQVIKTSKLINDRLWTTPVFQWQLIQEAIADQRKNKAKGNLLATNLFIQGRGTRVELGEDFTRLQNRRDSENPDVEKPEKPQPEKKDDQEPKAPNDGPPDPPPVESDPGLKNFTFIGSSDFFGGESSPQFDPELSGNVSTVGSLPDPDGGTDVLPTSGATFDLISTGGNTEDGNLRTGSLGTDTIGEEAPGAPPKTFVEFDYRFLTNDDQDFNNDEFTLTISGTGGDEISYNFNKEMLIPLVPRLLQVGPSGPAVSALGRNNVGGYLAGTDWLTLKVDITPLLAQGNTIISLQMNDYNDNDLDSAVAIDRYQITQENLVAPNSELPGTLTLNFRGTITLGEGVGEVRVPSFRGRENTQSTGPGSNGGNFYVTSSQGGNIIVKSDILADTGPNKSTAFGGRGGNVSLFSNGGKVQVDRKIVVSSNDPGSRRVSESGGNIYVAGDSATDNSVEISNSGELLSLLNAAAPGPGGSIFIQGGTGNVLINGGKVIATRGLVDIRTFGTNGTITVNNADVRGDVVKLGALGTNGNLMIGGGQISADTTLKLYAGGSNGNITFTNNTTLGNAAAEKILVANTVTILDNKVVTVQGRKADVYTSNPNYSGSGGNGSTTGKFNADGEGANTFKPNSSPPPPSAPSFD